MSKFWNTDNQKIATTVGMGITGYYVLSQAITSLPSLPLFVTKPLIGPISIVVLAAGLTISGIFFLRKF